MIKQHIRYILILLLGTVICYQAAAQNIKTDARLDSAHIRIGDQTALHLSIRIPAKESAVFPIIADSIGKVQIVGSKADTVFDKNDAAFKTISHNYTLTSFDAGTYVIPQYTIHTQSGDYKTDSLTMQVSGVKVDTTKAIYDIKQPLQVSYTFLDWLRDNGLWVGLGFAVLLIITGIIYYLKKVRKQKPAVEVPKVIIPPHVIALNKLTELRNKKLWQQDMVKEYHSELTDVLREYLENRYNIKAHEQTTEEILNSLRYSGIAEDNRNKLYQMLVLADLVKFAKERPAAADNEHSMDNAVQFITGTQILIRPGNREEDRN